MSVQRQRRRPIGRRLMAALFVLMMVPTAGWYFLGDLTSRDLWGALPSVEQAALAETQREVRLKLALTLAASIIALGGALIYLRRSALDPLASLARRARTVGEQPWQSPAEMDRPDEIGDLARALDRGVQSLEARAEEAARFAANLSHELRTPLAAIRGAAEILADPELDTEDRERFVNNVLTESQRLERLVGGILDMARAERDHQHIHPIAVDLCAVIQSVLDTVEPLLQRKSLNVDFQPGSTPPMVAVNPDRLRRILLGLLENAIKLSPRGNAIGISASLEDGEIVTRVTDRGPGVPVELRSVIFERQFTAEHDGARVARGTGLGLAIVHSLVASSGGRIWIEDRPGGGACFALALAPANGH